MRPLLLGKTSKEELELACLFLRGYEQAKQQQSPVTQHRKPQVPRPGTRPRDDWIKRIPEPEKVFYATVALALTFGLICIATVLMLWLFIRPDVGFSPWTRTPEGMQATARLYDGQELTVTYRGLVSDVVFLPKTGNRIGDVYFVGDTHWVWAVPAEGGKAQWFDP